MKTVPLPKSKVIASGALSMKGDGFSIDIMINTDKNHALITVQGRPSAIAQQVLRSFRDAAPITSMLMQHAPPQVAEENSGGNATGNSGKTPSRPRKAPKTKAKSQRKSLPVRRMRRKG